MSLVEYSITVYTVRRIRWNTKRIHAPSHRYGGEYPNPGFLERKSKEPAMSDEIKKDEQALR
jgi:hypothetical protein